MNSGSELGLARWVAATFRRLRAIDRLPRTSTPAGRAGIALAPLQLRSRLVGAVIGVPAFLVDYLRLVAPASAARAFALPGPGIVVPRSLGRFSI